MRGFLWICLRLSLPFLLTFALPGLSAGKKMIIGYQLVYNPWKVVMEGSELERATGYKIDWRRLDTPAKVLSAMASGQVQIGLLGSTGVTTAMTRGLDVELFYIAEGIADAEALVVRNGSGIENPDDLRGKKLGVPFVSTTHFHTLVALEHFGIDPTELTIFNMPPNAIAAAWLRGDIDAAFVWDPALSRIKKTGRVLISSGELGKLGKPTFDGLVVRREFARENDDFMTAFVEILARTDADYRDNPKSWSADSKQVKAIVKRVGGNPSEVPAVLASYVFPTMAEQASCQWLGCGKEGGAARAILATADFLVTQKQIPESLPDYSPFINSRWVEAVAARQK